MRTLKKAIKDLNILMDKRGCDTSPEELKLILADLIYYTKLTSTPIPADIFEDMSEGMRRSALAGLIQVIATALMK